MFFPYLVHPDPMGDDVNRLGNVQGCVHFVLTNYCTLVKKSLEEFDFGIYIFQSSLPLAASPQSEKLHWTTTLVSLNILYGPVLQEISFKDFSYALQGS